NLFCPSPPIRSSTSLALHDALPISTQLISYAGKKFLVDPMLAKKEAYPGFEGTARSDIRIPMTELPFDLDVLLDVDAIIVTHTHPDHWDEAAVAHIPKDKLIYVQNEHDEKILRSQGFSNLVIQIGRAHV